MSAAEKNPSSGLLPVWQVWAVLAGASIAGYALAEGAATAPSVVTLILMAGYWSA